ncbi:MAG TPA: alpha/beta hydrolase, partial [Candidatus Flavonifractor merdigallinarum]|nr:alpha/beta hydrolase [Candidatus Flavonifractor merdigallinarum]
MKQVYIHGLGQTPASWEPVLHLLDTSSDAICPDLTKMVSAEDATYSTLYHSFTRFCDGLETP